MKSTAETAIGDIGALLGTCHARQEGRKADIKLSPFGWWIKGLVEQKVKEAKEKHGKEKAT